MKRRWVIALVLGILVAPAYAMRCGDNLIDKGDVNAKVVARCGAPYVINTYVVYEVIDYSFHHKIRSRSHPESDRRGPPRPRRGMDLQLRSRPVSAACAIHRELRH